MGINFGGVIAGIDKEWTRQIESKDRKEKNLKSGVLKQQER